MADYSAPIWDIQFILEELAGVKEIASYPGYAEFDPSLIEPVLAEAARFIEEEIAPLNKVGDKHGTPLKDGKVTTPPGWKETYKAWTDAGWNAIAGPEEFGGQELPTMMAVAGRSAL